MSLSLALIGTHAYVNPVVALLAGFYVLGESLTRIQIFGVVLIIAAVYGSLQAPRPKANSEKAGIWALIRYGISSWRPRAVGITESASGIDWTEIGIRRSSVKGEL